MMFLILEVPMIDRAVAHCPAIHLFVFSIGTLKPPSYTYSNRSLHISWIRKCPFSSGTIVLFIVTSDQGRYIGCLCIISNKKDLFFYSFLDILLTI